VRRTAEHRSGGRARPQKTVGLVIATLAGLAALVALVALVAGCAAPLPTVAPSPSDVGTISPTVRPPSPTPGARTPAPGATRPDLAAVVVGVQELAGGLDQPLWIAPFGSGDGSLLVAEQPGRIRQIAADGSVVTQPFLDITERVASGGERGLLGFAVPPDFGPTDPVVYVHYSNRDGDTTLSAFRLDAHDTTRLDPDSEVQLLTVDQPYPNHNGGWLGFDADGMLLLALGDGGSAGDPENRASDTGQLLGKILRLDVSGVASGGTSYAIPPDNPFADGQSGRPEILHLGLRNPFRASVDPVTGNLWIGDVGQNAWEEVDVAPAGARGLDFGWRRWEGRHCYDPSPASDCSEAGVTMPVTEYGHGAGCSVIGGVVYRGEAIPALRGAYLFSDYCSGTLWAIDAGLDAQQAPVTLLETGRQVSAIGTDEAGEVVLTDLGGAVLRLVPADCPPPRPKAPGIRRRAPRFPPPREPAAGPSASPGAGTGTGRCPRTRSRSRT
jgi:glucose/arabinose dehydrogenase